jgi:hypothetical protein
VIALGIDPGGNDGALAVVDARHRPAAILQAVAWSISHRKHGDVMRVWTLFGGPTTVHPDLFHRINLGGFLRTAGADRAAVEGHPPRMGGRAHGMNLAHVREIGRVCGWVEALTGLTPTTPAPAVWRRTVFRIPPGTDAKACDAMILARLPALVTLPPDVPAWAMKHLPDACGVALYAAMERP